MRRCFIAVWLVIGLAAAPRQADADGSFRADELGLDVPRGSRVIGDQLWNSGLGFRKTVQFYERLLKRRGLAHEAVPIYGYRGVSVARFVSTAEDTPWRAIHVFWRRGVTRVYLVPRSPLTPSMSHGKYSPPHPDGSLGDRLMAGRQTLDLSI